MRLFGIVFLLVSNVSFSQNQITEIACGFSFRTLDQEAYRISNTPEKLSLNNIDSTTDDTVSSGNENQLIVSLPRTNAIYAGYDNLIQVAFPNKKSRKAQLKCDGCDTLYQLPNASGSDWVIRANTSTKVVLSLVNKKGKILSEKEIPVLSLPRPTVFIDGVNAQSILKELPKQIRLKYDETVPLSVKFSVHRWEIRINGGDHFGGYGSAIPKNIHDLMKSTKYGTISIYLSYYGPNGKHEMREIFGFNLD